MPCRQWVGPVTPQNGASAWLNPDVVATGAQHDVRPFFAGDGPSQADAVVETTPEFFDQFERFTRVGDGVEVGVFGYLLVREDGVQISGVFRAQCPQQQVVCCQFRKSGEDFVRGDIVEWLLDGCNGEGEGTSGRGAFLVVK